jgi:hypothetical protein
MCNLCTESYLFVQPRDGLFVKLKHVAVGLKTHVASDLRLLVYRVLITLWAAQCNLLTKHVGYVM